MGYLDVARGRGPLNAWLDGRWRRTARKWPAQPFNAEGVKEAKQCHPDMPLLLYVQLLLKDIESTFKQDREWNGNEWNGFMFQTRQLCTICNGIVMAVFLALQSLGWQISSSASAKWPWLSPPFGSESYRFPGTGNEKLQCVTWQDFQGESTSSYFAFNIILSIRQIPQYLKIS